MNNINTQAIRCLDGCTLKFKTKDYKSRYKDEEEYQDSFDSIIKFSSGIKSSVKKSINCIIFNKQNSDGLFSCYLTIKYLKKYKSNNNIEINIIPIGPHSGMGVDFNLKKHEKKIDGSNLIVLDLSYNKESINYLKKLSKNLIIIDDHSISNNALKKSNLNKNSYFIGDETHATVAYTFKFFHPSKRIPQYVQIFDSDDRKLFLSHIGYTRPFINFVNYRFVHNPRLRWDNVKSFEKIDKVISDTSITFTKFVGHYYDELVNSMKEQISRNARKVYFQGHPVMVLNYRTPTLGKVVMRQMLTNAKEQGLDVDFAVTWAFEYTNMLYNIQMAEEHIGAPKFNLPEMARKIGKLGGSGKGGGGSKFTANCYIKRTKNMDIWDFFGKDPKYLV
jgi:hypothetical protein